MNQLPPSLERYEPLLEAAVARDIERSGSRSRLLGRRGRSFATRTAMVGATAIAAVAVLTFSGAIGGGPFVQKAAAAQAAAVLASVPSDGIFHLHIVGTQPNPDGTVVSWENESWRATTSPVASRGIERGPFSPVVEWGTDGVSATYLYDAATNTIFQAPVTEPVFDPGSVDEGFRAEALAMLESGEAVEDGGELVDGREAIRIASRDGRIVYLVDAATFNPIEWRTKGDGGSSSLRFRAYETLPATPENLALLDLVAMHPDATLDTDPEHFRDAQARLYPNG